MVFWGNLSCLEIVSAALKVCLGISVILKVSLGNSVVLEGFLLLWRLLLRCVWGFQLSWRSFSGTEGVFGVRNIY